MTRDRAPDPLERLREAALDQLADGAAPVDLPVESLVDSPVESARRGRPVDPALAALFPPGVTVVPEMLAAAARTWREATEREAPSIDRLAAPGTLQRVDADLTSGYVSVVTADDTWRAFLPRDQLATIVGLMTRRPIDEVARTLALGPGAIVPPGVTQG